MSADIIQPTDCKFSCELNDKCAHPRVFKLITGTAKHPIHRDVASIRAVKIFRHFCRGHFLDAMDEGDDELHELADTLFDKFGVIRPWLVSAGYRRGTGSWGYELNSGDIIFIKDIDVRDPYKGQGLGTWILQEFLESGRVERNDTVMCRPKPPSTATPEEWTKVQDSQIAFLRKSNFRRIGRTRFFGYSPNPNHPSRLLPADADADREENEFTPPGPAPADKDEFMRTYPLHFAILNLPRQHIAGVIEAYHAQDLSSIHKQDNNGFTPLYVAAAYANVPAVRALLELGAKSDLNNHVNKDRMIPLERLEDTMRTMREFSEMLSHKWEGYSTNELKVQLILKREMGISVNGQTDEEYLQKRQWGCTCGECLEGWLSPRMRFRLETEAALSKDNMTLSSPRFQRGHPVSEESPTICLPLQFDYLPPSLRQNVYKSFYNGYVTIFYNLYLLLNQTELVPTVSHLRTLCKGDRDVNFYLKKGGKFEYALESMVEGAKSQSCLGDSMFEEIWESENDTEDEYRKLPRCANDLEFDLVKRMVGVPPKGPALPAGIIGSVQGPGGMTLEMLVNKIRGVEEEEEEEEEENYSDLLNPHYAEIAAGRRQARSEARRAAAAAAAATTQAQGGGAASGTQTQDLAFQKLLSLLPQGGVRAPIN